MPSWNCIFMLEQVKFSAGAEKQLLGEKLTLSLSSLACISQQKDCHHLDHDCIYTVVKLTTKVVIKNYHSMTDQSI